MPIIRNYMMNKSFSVHAPFAAETIPRIETGPGPNRSRVSRRFRETAAIAFFVMFVGCSPFSAEPRPGPDKQGSGLLYGAAVGAGSGAVTGAQFAAGAGPGAWVGAGFGAVFGALSGLGVDVLEEDQLQSAEQLQCLREKAWVTEVLEEHYSRRLQLHPHRDIYPADLFFQGDDSKLTSHSRSLVKEIARLNQNRIPTSRVQIVSYVMAQDPESTYAKHLTTKRAEQLALEFVRAGIEARRVNARGVILRDALVIDPYDKPGRYRQAIEIVFLDR